MQLANLHHHRHWLAQFTTPRPPLPDGPQHCMRSILEERHNVNKSSDAPLTYRCLLDKASRMGLGACPPLRRTKTPRLFSSISPRFHPPPPHPARLVLRLLPGRWGRVGHTEGGKTQNTQDMCWRSCPVPCKCRRESISTPCLELLLGLTTGQATFANVRAWPKCQLLQKELLCTWASQRFKRRYAPNAAFDEPCKHPPSAVASARADGLEFCVR